MFGFRDGSISQRIEKSSFWRNEGGGSGGDGTFRSPIKGFYRISGRAGVRRAGNHDGHP
jgi:hypothetical protein